MMKILFRGFLFVLVLWGSFGFAYYLGLDMTQEFSQWYAVPYIISSFVFIVASLFVLIVAFYDYFE